MTDGMNPSPDEVEAVASLDLAHLAKVNGERWAAWANGGSTDLLYAAIELGGEAGEVLNVAKKIEREARGWRGSRATLHDLGDELADVVICADSLARAAGVSLAEAVVRKFNATSDKVGLPHKLPTLPSREEPERALREETADAIRFRYLLEHRSHHYGMDMAQPSPAEWGITWDYQQIKPGEQFLSIRALIDEDIAALDEEARAVLAQGADHG